MSAPSTEKRALIVRGGWTGHQPVETTDAFVPFLAAHGYDVRVEDETTVYADPEYMAGVDVVVQTNTMNTIAGDELGGLITAVRNGTGLAGWHGGIADSYRNSSDYLQLIGGQFATHPSREPSQLRQGSAENNYLDYTVEITDLGRRHEITAGIDDFRLTTEQYWVLHDDLIDVLATTTHPVQPYHPWHRPITSPAVWTRDWGQGRVFVSTPGHSLDVLQDANVRTIIERGILWAAR